MTTKPADTSYPFVDFILEALSTRCSRPVEITIEVVEELITAARASGVDCTVLVRVMDEVLANLPRANAVFAEALNRSLDRTAVRKLCNELAL